MKTKPWVRTYLIIVGSTAFSLGVILLSRSLMQHQSYPAIFLGASLMIYGFLRLRQSQQLPVQR